MTNTTEREQIVTWLGNLMNDYRTDGSYDRAGAIEFVIFALEREYHLKESPHG